MNTEYKERKAAVRTRRTKPTTTDEPEEVIVLLLIKEILDQMLL